MSSAEDLAQETLMRAWSGLARLRDDRSFGSWLLSTADNVCREWIRKKQTRERHRGAVAAPAATAPPGDPDPRLAEAVAALAPDAQQILALRHDRGMTCEEIARELGRPTGTVTKTLSRAYAELRERLGSA
ncbi:MAG: sigma-70 family RNA polymerase sigma factor [Planctomycetes bacterium]|nr:sigma-70 family RNA polymerase sigma factor [Planctomycetota bacterium]